jgi:hypothetical protein
VLRTLILTILVCSSGKSHAGAEQFLPKEMRKFVFQKTTSADVVKALGKPKEIDKGQKEVIYYYNKNGVDFDTVLSFRNNKLHYIFLSNIKDPPSLKELKLFFTEQDFLKALEDSKFGATHEAGRFVDLENKKEGLKVRVRNNDKRDVHEITVWKKDLIDL